MTMPTLLQRLLDHAALHDALSAHDDEQKQWADDLREAAAALEAAQRDAKLLADIPPNPNPPLHEVNIVTNDGYGFCRLIFNDDDELLAWAKRVRTALSTHQQSEGG